MKVKTSIILSSDLLEGLDAFGKEFKNRSEAIGHAIQFFIQAKKAKKREARDFKILNKKTSILNREADDTLEYQIDL